VRLAVGIDLVDVRRIREVLARHPERFQSRHFTPAECAQCRAEPQRLATRWAAKEAAAKALGTGIGAVGWQEIEVLCDARGEPALRLHGEAAQRAALLGIGQWKVSLTHTNEQAAAVVVGCT
jgi:holo-[acyl-carrier protein] synthase